MIAPIDQVLVSWVQHKKLPLLELKGSNYEIGLQHGQQAAELIRDFAKTLLQQAQQKNPGVTKEQALSFAKRLVPSVEEFAPHLIDEMKGIADGAGVPHEEIYFLNARNEMYSRKIPTGCTAFGLSGSKTADGQVMLGQNADAVGSVEKSLVMMRIVPNKGPKILQYARAGTVAHIGINSYGLGRVGNGVSASDFRELGVPKVILDRVCIEQRSIDDVVKVIRIAKRAISNNYIFADSTGKIVDVEVTSYQDRVLDPVDGVLSHANNYEHPDFVRYDLIPKGSESHRRAARIKELIASEKSAVTEDIAENWLRDHEGPLCRHPEVQKTVGSIVSRPARGLMHVCWGNPCVGEYHTYEL
jgi:isopenicillin-N N-acyltransferase-like protein